MMKARFSEAATFLAGLFLAANLVAMPTLSKAAPLYWGGGSSSISGNGTGTAVSTAGTWNTTIQNWDVGVAPYVVWNNVTNANDTAMFFANSNYTVSVTSNVTLGGLNATWSGATRTLSMNSTTSTLNFSPGSIIDNTTGNATNYGVFSITAGISGAPALNIHPKTNTANTFNPSTGLSQHFGTVSINNGVSNVADTTLALQGASDTVNSMSGLFAQRSGGTGHRYFITKDTSNSTWSIGNVDSATSAAQDNINIQARQGLLTFTGDIEAHTLEIGNAINDNATVALSKPSAAIDIVNIAMAGGILHNSSGGSLTFTTSAADNTNNNRVSQDGLRFQGGDMVFQANRIIKLNTNNATFDVMTTGQTVTFSGNVTQITSARNLIKAGPGTLALGGSNTYNGTTTITGGTLAITGTGSINATSSITINGGKLRYASSVNLTRPVTFTSGTLGGTNWAGSLNNLTIGGNQTISPGNSPGTATTGNQTWAGGGTYVWEVNDASGIAGNATAGWDLETFTGLLDITATSGNPFVIDIVGLDAGNAAGVVPNFNNTGNYTWLIADAALPITGFNSSNFTLTTGNFTNNNPLSGGSFSIVLGDSVGGGDNTQIYLRFVPVPEPAALALAVAGIAGLGYAARRRQRR